MMNDMEGGHMTVLLPEDEEECVEEFGEFGEVVPPTRPRHLCFVFKKSVLGLRQIPIIFCLSKKFYNI